MELPQQSRQNLLNLAKGVVRRRLQTPAAAPASSTPPVDLPEFADAANDPQLRTLAGCFVSLHRNDTHALRGCIGLLQSTVPLIAALCDAAEAVLKDPRFTKDPVTSAEVDRLEIELTIIGPMRQATSPLDFDLLQHGIYLTVNGRNGCFLPQVARETGWPREQLLARLCAEKLGLPPDAWQNPAAILHTFTTDVIGPAPL